MTSAYLVTLLAILVFGFAVRRTGLVDALYTPGSTWEDPDGYIIERDQIDHASERTAIEVRVPGR